MKRSRIDSGKLRPRDKNMDYRCLPIYGEKNRPREVRIGNRDTIEASTSRDAIFGINGVGETYN